MSIYVLGSSEVVTAFALGGMPGRPVTGRREALAALEDREWGEHPGLLLVEDRVVETIRAEVDRLKLDPSGPLVVEIPGFEGPAGERRTPMEMVRRALGINL